MKSQFVQRPLQNAAPQEQVKSQFVQRPLRNAAPREQVKSQFVQRPLQNAAPQEQEVLSSAQSVASLQGDRALSSSTPPTTIPYSLSPTLPITPPDTMPTIKRNGLLSSGRSTVPYSLSPTLPIIPPDTMPTIKRNSLLSSGRYTNKSSLLGTVGAPTQQVPPQVFQRSPITDPSRQAPARPASPVLNATRASFVGTEQGIQGMQGARQRGTANVLPPPLMPPMQPMPLQRPQPTNTPIPPPRPRRKSFPTWARLVFAVFAVMLVLLGIGAGYYQTTFAGHLSNITGQKAATITIKDKDGLTQSSTSAGNASIGSSRINILLLGSDDDSKFSAPLAQTDIVVTIDPQTNYVGMLSIPRDLWLNVPGIGMHKLDEAFAEGWQYEHQGPTPFSNAVGLSILTIEQDFGIHIDHYAWVGLDGFIQVINTAGGVDINVTHPMVDDTYPNDIQTTNAYSYKRLYIAPGPQHMNGLQALEYVRTRHSDLVGDFGRSARQQQVLSQLKTKLDTPGIISELPQLAQELDGTVKTDMDLQTLVSLMNYARNLDPNKVDHAVLSPPYSKSYTAPNGEDAFLPICSQITPVIAKMFALGSNAMCNVTAESGNTPTLAAATPGAATQSLTGNSLQTLPGPGSPAQVGLTSLSSSLSGGTSDPFGLRSMLDMMFMVVFESFDAAKV